jgi:hypothetical protein
MTLYFRRYKICNPLKPHSMEYLEAILAAEAAERKKKEKAAKRKEEPHVIHVQEPSKPQEASEPITTWCEGPVKLIVFLKDDCCIEK